MAVATHGILLHTKAPPLRADEGSVIRVGNRRDAESKVLRIRIEAKHPPVSRDELLARR